MIGVSWTSRPYFGYIEYNKAVADPGGARGARAPPSKKKKWGPIFYNGVVKNVICQYLYTI